MDRGPGASRRPARLGRSRPPTPLRLRAATTRFLDSGWLKRHGPAGRRQLSSSWWTPAVFRYRQSPRRSLPPSTPGLVRCGRPSDERSRGAGHRHTRPARTCCAASSPCRIRVTGGDTAVPTAALPGTRSSRKRASTQGFTPSEAALAPSRSRSTCVAGWTGPFPGRHGCRAAVSWPPSSRAGPSTSSSSRPGARPAAGDAIARRHLQRAKISKSRLLRPHGRVHPRGALLRRANLRLGRRDKAGAVRLALGVFVLAAHARRTFSRATLQLGARRSSPGLLGEPR